MIRQRRKAVSRWQPWLFDLRTSGALKYVAAGFARYQYEEHNRRHQGDRRVTSVEVFQVQEVPGEPEPNKGSLARYQETK